MAEQSGDRVENRVGTNFGPLVQAGTVLGGVNFYDTSRPPLAQRALLPEPSLPARFPPSALLRSEYKIVPFHGRGDELDDLVAWCGTDEPIGIRLCTGPGGQGKTRLALEMIALLVGRGWTAGRLRTGCDESTLGELCALPADTLLVVDYAESQPEQVGTLLEVAAARPAGAGRLRLLLLARSAAEWWPQLQAAVVDDGIAALMDEAEHALSPLFGDPADRSRLFTQALLAFADHGGWPRVELVPPDDLAQQRFASALALHMAALAALLDHQDAVEPTRAYRDPAARVLHHEQRYWKMTAQALALPHTQPRTLRTVITIASCCGATSRDEAVELMDRVPDLGGEHERVRGQYADWAHELHPGERWLNSVTPDLLCERLVADVLVEQPELAVAVGRAAVTTEQQFTLCTLLGRAAEQHASVRNALGTIVASGADRLWLVAAALTSYLARPDLMQAALIESVDGVTDRNILWYVAEQMPHTHRSCELKIAIAEQALRQFHDGVDRDVVAEAGLHLALADALTSANRFDEALEHYRGAIRLFQKIVPDQPERCADHYLRALCNYATQLDNNGRHDEALKVCDRVLAEAERYGSGDDGYLRASVWWCRSQARHNRKQPAKAAKAMERAVAECRAAVASDERAKAHLPLMIMNLANRYSDLGWHDEALKTMEESVSIYRERESAHPDPLNPSFGQVLFNYSACLYDCGRPQEGRAALVEAARRLARVTEHHTPRLPLLWSVLEVWGRRLAHSDFADETVRAEYEELATLHARTDWPVDGRRGRTAFAIMLDYWVKLGQWGDRAKAEKWRRKTFEIFPVQSRLLWRAAQVAALRSSVSTRDRAGE
ncbi:tetratricopeptide repeat protein [Goodfellowiella coeruleoviolacea]|uniref:Tetratricopeptide repeat-containing protein n=1 Tax=Goodfellowiella coeruleoviolacea TaxID=334858 RepID=A0AAE3GJK2_9PSEU|nr:tetratricopeptide repeat protein [Goodfellowiella coeruleoviolacea]MCP2168597.1 Tetratricopeptide repeat-containing protein [Goodfellowiella coeruleoviolacea]